MYIGKNNLSYLDEGYLTVIQYDNVQLPLRHPVPEKSERIEIGKGGEYLFNLYESGNTFSGDAKLHIDKIRLQTNTIVESFTIHTGKEV